MIQQVSEMQGLGKTVMFCGDGINDLAALRAADIGFAVGATDATVAASLSTSQASVAGGPSDALLQSACPSVFINCNGVRCKVLPLISGATLGVFGTTAKIHNQYNPIQSTLDSHF